MKEKIAIGIVILILIAVGYYLIFMRETDTDKKTSDNKVTDTTDTAVDKNLTEDEKLLGELDSVLSDTTDSLNSVDSAESNLDKVVE